jgi:hypothetical protein
MINDEDPLYYKDKVTGSYGFYKNKTYNILHFLHSSGWNNDFCTI